MKVAIVGKTFLKKECYPFVQLLLSELDKLGSDIYIVEHFYKDLRENQVIQKEYYTFLDHTAKCLDETHFCFSIGGDGTLLESATYIKDRDIPIVGINAGRLGFLATIPLDSIRETLSSLLSNNYRIDERILVQLHTPDNLFDDLNFGLNEFVITKRDTSSMIIIHTYVNDLFLNSYWADGLIVSTPTGSTAYSISCGGPLVMPNTNNFIISPINPHNLNVRPMIIPDTSEIRFQVEGRSDNFLVSLDSRSKVVTAETEMSLTKANFKVKLVELSEVNYFNTLRSKLNWGLDSRN
ncbi:MAG: NAD kinase [Cytophagales bacterium]|nr:NAD kinase [Cytophagales bacterium]